MLIGAFMPYTFCRMRTPLLAVCLPLLAMGATNGSERIELHCNSRMVRISDGLDEPASSGRYDVRVYDTTNGSDSDTQSQPTGGERTLKLIFEKERWMWRLQAVA